MVQYFERRTYDVQRKSQFHSPVWGSLRLAPIILGECRALWGEPERVQCGQILLLVLELEFMEILVNMRCIYIYISASLS